VSETTNPASLPPAVTAAWDIDPISVEPVVAGHINLTFRANRSDGERCIVQRVNPIFPPVVNRDIDAVARHLLAKGELSPIVLPTRTGEQWLETDDAVWRALSFIEGNSTEALADARAARAAGELLGRFHAALADLDYTFQSVRSDPHETPRHIAALESALATHRAHRAYASVEPLARDILHAARALEPLPAAPLRVVHGDPKLSNLLFDPATGAGLCLVDLDTLGRRSIATELGDAFRSWCNPAGEDSAGATFAVELFAPAMAGYLSGSGGLLERDERSAIPDAVHTIAIELAARFCADALNERFFGWDRRRFSDASTHNLARASAQLAVADAARSARDRMHEIVTE
jgi:Ser/Thr protein kinase RdoA (MazF antagonist)